MDPVSPYPKIVQKNRDDMGFVHELEAESLSKADTQLGYCIEFLNHIKNQNCVNDHVVTRMHLKN